MNGPMSVLAKPSLSGAIKNGFTDTPKPFGMNGSITKRKKNTTNCCAFIPGIKKAYWITPLWKPIICIIIKKPITCCSGNCWITRPTIPTAFSLLEITILRGAR
jgi:hypothetical protein